MAGFITRKVPWTSQPPVGTEIDLGNPLCRGLAYVKNFANMRYPDEVGRDFPTIVDFTQDAGFMQTTGAASDYFNTGYAPLLNITSTPKDSVSALMITRIALNSDGTFYAFRDGDLDSEVNLQLYTIDSGDGIRSRVQSDNDYLDQGNTINDEQWHIIGHTLEFGTDTTIWIDGKIGSGGVKTLTENGNSTTVALSIGQWGTATGYPLDAQFQLFAFWYGRKLTGQEHAMLAQNPWQIFKPKTQRIPNGVIVAGGIPPIHHHRQLIGAV